MTDYENLMSRERKRRNKEKKAARMASLGIFAGQSPLSMLHAGAALGLPSAPLAHHHHYVGDMSSHDLSPLFLQMPDSRLEGQSVDSQFGPRRRRGISDTRATTMQHRFGPLTSPLPDASFQNASVSQPPTPAQAYRYYQSLAMSPAQQHGGAPFAPNAPAEFYSGPLSAPLVPSVTAGPFFNLNQPTTPGSHQQHQQHPQPQMMASPHIVDLMGLSTASSMPVLPSGRASATEADFDLGLVDLTNVPTMVPTSAHVRPVDLPAPHGHFDFASVPFPTQDTFASELPIAALRRRSSIHLPVGTADAFFRRPSVAEVATAALMQKVAGKRNEKVNTDVKELAEELLSTDSTGIVAWNAHVQSQMPASMAAWSGFQSTSYEVCTKHESNEYVLPIMPTSRSNSDGLLSLGPLSPPAPLVSSGLVKAEQGAEEISATSSCSVSSSTGDSSIQAEVPMLEHSYFATQGGKVSRDISPFALSPSGSSHPSSLVAQEAWTSFRPDNLPLLSPVSELNANFNSFSVFANPSATSGQQPQSGKPEEVLLDSNSLSMAFGHNANF